MTSAVPQASLATGTHPGQLVVWALDEEHQKIRELTEGLQQAQTAGDDRLLEVYNITGVSSRAVREVLDPLLNDDVLITGDDKSQRLFIRATARQHKRIHAMIDQIKPALHRPLQPVTRVYTFPNPDAEAARTAVSSIVPAARLATDSEQRRLVATGTEVEQRIIASVVQQMTEQGDLDRTPKPVTYPIKQADASNMLAVLRRLYSDREDVQLSLDENNQTLIAVATAKEHQTIRTLVEQLEANDAVRPEMSTRFYPLQDVDGGAAKTLTQTILDSQSSQGTVILESRSNQLIVTAATEAHARVENILLQLQETKRLLEVFQLDVIGATNAQFALEGLFLNDDLSADRAPQIQSDDESQQLLVRGTTEQIDQIRSTLIKMGETQLSTTREDGQRKSLRVIPFDGNLESTLQRLEQIWPRIRKNPLRVVVPSSPLRRIEPAPQPPPGQRQPDQRPGHTDDTPGPPDCGTQAPPPQPRTAQDRPTQSESGRRPPASETQADQSPV
ncbi:MAG: secretin N-terminal domain-containing protein, partial [Planctomycetaceae bacterium]